MKKYILLSIIALVSFSCKKSESIATTGLYDVTFMFRPNGNPSEMTFKDLQTGEVKSYNQGTDVTFSKQVKVGQKFFLEMKGKANGLDNGYYVAIQYKNAIIAKNSPHGAAGVRDQVVSIDKTFYDMDFQNK